MAIVLALPKLFDDVVAAFAADGMVTPQVFGWRDPGQRVIDGDRIIWTPGDDEDGAFGEIGAAKQPGRNPRPLGTVFELFTVRIVAADTDNPENERAQYQAVRELYDAWYRACWNAARTTFSVQDQRWLIEKKDRRYGAGLRVLCTVEAMIPDGPAAVDVSTGLGVKADNSTTVLNVTETDLQIKGAP